jgi:hypothetical protein
MIVGNPGDEAHVLFIIWVMYCGLVTAKLGWISIGLDFTVYCTHATKSSSTRKGSEIRDIVNDEVVFTGECSEINEMTSE